LGINEDWVCGTANTLIGPYWAKAAPELAKAVEGEDNVVALESVQLSRRGGSLGIRWDGKWGQDNGIVSLLGTAKRE
jgi:predicted PhzF superfamily epimerase YddE/YHI9